jgi:hypothetical protein
MSVVVMLADPFLDFRIEFHRLVIGDIVSNRRPDLLIPCSELLASVDIRNRSKINEFPPVVSIDHDVHLLQIAMNDLLLVQEEQGQANILYYLHLGLLSQPRFSQITWIVLQVDLAIVKGDRGGSVAVAVVLSDIGTDFISDVL